VQPYPYAARRWRMRLYTIIAFSVNGFVSLTAFTSLPLFRRARIQSQQFENARRHGSGYLPITRALSLKTFTRQSGESARAERISSMHSAARRVTCQHCRQLLQVERQLLHTSNKRKLHTIYCKNYNYN
jgi:hypothetical protein